VRALRIAMNAAIILAAGCGVAFDMIGSDPLMAISAFTVQGSVLALVMAAVTLVLTAGGRAGGPAYVVWKGMSLLSVLLTFVVFNLALRSHYDAAELPPIVRAGDVLLHVVVPLAMLLEYLAFEAKGRMRAWHPLAWLAFPAAWLGFTVVYMSLGGRYDYLLTGSPTKFPYFFLDYETLGLPTVALWLAVIVAGYIGVGYLVYAIDRLLGRRRR